ncbi:hypothetical protein GCM10007853_30020 [Algimonas ampicilliniresistens]|uniref:Uncharacterized protein n=1 Tax=Algimonas ampicilliniresistens TaxID=1298735 RepID=A0ABQ5VCA6_9PROT|nr:hypothetical protein [Algimonas ampicilliniresistens]GLQ25128.1 hypothetical protein GCM10007853_30020 [Algimonas ampicilliniresistens]
MTESCTTEWSKIGLRGPILQIMADLCSILSPHIPAAGDPYAWTALVTETQRQLGLSEDVDALAIIVAIGGMGFGLREVADWPAAWEVANLGASEIQRSEDNGQNWTPARMKDLAASELTARPAFYEILSRLFDDTEYEKAELTFMQRTNSDLQTFYTARVDMETDGHRSLCLFGPWRYVMEKPDQTAAAAIPSEALKAAQAAINREVG